MIDIRVSRPLCPGLSYGGGGKRLTAVDHRHFAASAARDGQSLDAGAFVARVEAQLRLHIGAAVP
jgi:hypothetical protein